MGVEDDVGGPRMPSRRLDSCVFCRNAHSPLPGGGPWKTTLALGWIPVVGFRKRTFSVLLVRIAATRIAKLKRNVASSSSLRGSNGCYSEYEVEAQRGLELVASLSWSP